MAGDCYQANCNHILYTDSNKKYLLCHGVAILQTDGKPFGHCWLEVGDKVEDYSNGNEFSISKDLYYRLGGIPVKGYAKIYKYTKEEARKKIVETGVWGPWESKPPR
jgi:hypothetical protein